MLVCTDRSRKFSGANLNHRVATFGKCSVKTIFNVRKEGCRRGPPTTGWCLVGHVEMLSLKNRTRESIFSLWKIIIELPNGCQKIFDERVEILSRFHSAGSLRFLEKYLCTYFLMCLPAY